jgi:DNA-binding winged helix-turn-helix (wHTH) protein
MPPAVISRPHPDAVRHHTTDQSGSRPPHEPGPATPQVTVTVAVTITGADAISAADDIEDNLWNLATDLPDGASVVTVATTVESVRSRENPPAADRSRVGHRIPTTPQDAAGDDIRTPATDRSTVRTVPVPSAPGTTVASGPVAAPLKLFPASRIATLDGTPVQLTRREFDMLLHMARHPGRVFTRQQLSLAVWQEDFMRGERTIDVHIHRLRLKLADRGPTITTVRGVGYRLDAAHRLWLADEAAGS